METLASVKLSAPMLTSGLKSLQGPDYPLIPHSVVKTQRGAGHRAIATSADPVGDDKGVGAYSGSYSYPANPAFVSGAFDIIGFSADKEDSVAHFTLKFSALSNPGWHPEYGFQLTFVAIAIDTDGKPGTGKQTIGHNSGYRLAENMGFERLILVGGGVQLEDHEGRILCAYVPSPDDISNPLGDASTGTISFAIPLRFLGGDLSTAWNWTIMAGGQDDHGGAGLGEFRSVNRERGEWSGGGKLSPDAPNVYDDLMIRGRP